MFLNPPSQTFGEEVFSKVSPTDFCIWVVVCVVVAVLIYQLKG